MGISTTFEHNTALKDEESGEESLVEAAFISTQGVHESIDKSEENEDEISDEKIINTEKIDEV